MTRARGLPVRLGLLVAVLHACGGDGEAPEPLGDPNVTLVENASLPADSLTGWSIGAAPVLSIGEAEGNATHRLFQVRDATVLPGGRIAIANRGTGEIRVFEPDGRHVVSMGGAGEGPGEFRSLEVVHAWTADSVFGWDVRQQRVSVFDAEGAHGRTFRLTPFEDSFSPRLLGVTPDRRLLVRAGFPHRDDEPYEGMFRPLQKYGLTDGAGTLVANLGEHPGEEGFLLAAGGFESFYGHPHAKSTLSTVWADRVLISPNDTYALRAFATDGRPTTTIRLDQPDARPTREDMEIWFEAFTANDTPDERAAFRSTFEEFPLLESLPAFSQLIVDAEGHVWVRDFGGAGDGGASWVVFDPAGRVVGRMETPTGLEVYEIGADYLLGLARTELDVEVVQMWSLGR